MSLFHLSTEEIERRVMALLSELAARRHAGDCEQARVEFVCGAHVAEGLVFAPRARSDGTAAEHDRETLAYWLASVPDLDSVTVIVRRYGKVVRMAHIEPPLTLASGASDRPCPAPAT